MISVICPYHNCSKIILNAINSLLSQEVDNKLFEVIFIDDGSTDDTTNIVANNLIKFKQKNISSRIISQNHKGAGSARNLGINNSKYDFIAFLDADDRWKDLKLSKCISTIKKHENDVNLIIHDELFIRCDNSTQRIHNGNFYYSTIAESLYRRNTFSTSAIVLNKNLLKKYGLFNENLMSSQDYELWLRMAPNLKVIRIDEVLGEYYENPNGITSKYYAKRFLDQLRIAYKYRSYVSIPIYIYKICRILLSKQWIYGLSNLITSKKGHNY